jgi:CBS domain-containing protein
MTKNPLSVKRNTDAAEAARIMIENRIGGLPVVDGKLDGILTRGCLLKGFQISWK